LKTHNIIISGFGGQGIVAAGRLIAFAGMTDGKKVSMLPSYGPEMRGGFANCHVIISDADIASPIVSQADIVIAMSVPALNKFQPVVKRGGILIVDSHQVTHSDYRDDIRIIKIPATRIAMDKSNVKMSNMVMIGAMISVIGSPSLNSMALSIRDLLPQHMQYLFDIEMEMLEAGMAFEG
jgi:2-oxoglutarate ferredoxin oxidoreductase subunit gamma